MNRQVMASQQGLSSDVFIGRRKVAAQEEINIERVLLEARTRWLKPAEVVDILRNYGKYEFQLNQEPPVKPPSGSLYLFDRKLVRYFRKDGHVWRKKKDGKTVREAHEKLKAGSVDMLHCYYAHAEDDDRFQRRCYWMLEESMENIVLVHYREVEKGSGRVHQSPRSSAPSSPTLVLPRPSELVQAPLQKVPSAEPSPHVPESAAKGLPNVTITPPSPAEDYDSDGHDGMDDWEPDAGSPLLQQKGGLSVQGPPALPLQQQLSLGLGGQYGGSPSIQWPPAGSQQMASQLFPLQEQQLAGDAQVEQQQARKDSGFPLWQRSNSRGQIPGVVYNFEDLLKPATSVGAAGEPSPNLPDMGALELPWNGLYPDLSLRSNSTGGSREPSSSQPVTWTEMLASDTPPARENPSPSILPWMKLPGSNSTGSQRGGLGPANDNKEETVEGFGNFPRITSMDQRVEACFPRVLSEDSGLSLQSNEEGNSQLPSVLQILQEMRSDSVGRASLSGRDLSIGRSTGQCMELEKLDSFGLWVQDMCGEQQQQQEAQHQFRSPSFSKRGPKPVVLEPPAKILFNILDFTPGHSDPAGGTKILIAGSTELGAEQKWGCLFDNVEVSAEVVRPGVLRCQAPPHVTGTVTIAITADDGQPCSQLHQFEYGPSYQAGRGAPGQGETATETENQLQIRLVRLLLQNHCGTPTSRSRLDSHEDEWAWLEKAHQEKSRSFVQEQLMTMLLRQRMVDWARGEGAHERVKQRDDGLCAIHMAAALGYAWAIPLLTASGMDVDFPDTRGRTALHWAAASGREDVVVALLAAGAAPATLATWRVEQMGGATPAELAAGSGHAGIAAYLAEMSLNRSLSTMSLKERGLRRAMVEKVTKAGEAAVAAASEGWRSKSEKGSEGDQVEASLRAVRKAAEAAALIQSANGPGSGGQGGSMDVIVLKRPQNSADEYGLTEAEMKLMVASRKIQQNQKGHPEPFMIRHSAAVNIQKRYRGWKGRKDFLSIRQKIICMQAHIKGHLVRKSLKRMRWSVGILEKAILRWRRKRMGLRFLDHLPHRGQPAAVEGPLLVLSQPMLDTPSATHVRAAPEPWVNAGGRNAGLEIAVNCVQALAQSNEARAQYARLLQAQAQINRQSQGDELNLGSIQHNDMGAR